MNSVSEVNPPLSPYLKAMVGEGIMKPEIARVFTQLDSQEKQRLAFKELQKAQVRVADEVVSKLGWTQWKPPPDGVSPELGRRIWKNIRVCQALGKFLANVAVVPIGFLLVLLSCMPWIEAIVLLPFRFLEYLTRPLLDSAEMDEAAFNVRDYAAFQIAGSTLIWWTYLIALVWILWRAFLLAIHLAIEPVTWVCVVLLLLLIALNKAGQWLCAKIVVWQTIGRDSVPK